MQIHTYEDNAWNKQKVVWLLLVINLWDAEEISCYIRWWWVRSGQLGGNQEELRNKEHSEDLKLQQDNDFHFLHYNFYHNII